MAERSSSKRGLWRFVDAVDVGLDVAVTGLDVTLRCGSAVR
jgi:hypothetical protein